MMTKEELDMHIKVTGRAIRVNYDRDPRNEHNVYCFDCVVTGKKSSWFCGWSHSVYYGNIIILHNMLKFMLKVNRTRKTLKNKFGRNRENIPYGFDPDIQDRMIEEAKVKDLDKFK